MHHSQIGFIPSMQTSLRIHTLINAEYQLNKLRDKKLLGYHDSFKIPVLMKRALKKPGLDGTSVNIIGCICQT